MVVWTRMALRRGRCPKPQSLFCLDAKKEPKKIKADDALAGKLRISHPPKTNSDPEYRIVKQGFLSQSLRCFLPLISKAKPS
ncbi:hypothetical protein NC99_19700 [Sunxiuqinia dokdonensis]|uniref:Uncharacterized protein n=1 Tax=Sunxiuqinia dokdonensis TaxID=1409788 RepID=A0A0L8V9Q5_9BACT|nr:hypothetical protein NC99_19700 [Sunxiuqinia dokdonensis]